MLYRCSCYLLRKNGFKNKEIVHPEDSECPYRFLDKKFKQKIIKS